MLRVLVRSSVFPSLLLLSLAFVATGCGTAVNTDGPNAAPAVASTISEAPANQANEVDSSVSEDLAKLPPQDRALAEMQKTCPVTDALLGSMGAPCKVTVKGQTVFLCCDGCEEKLRHNADMYLAKLKNAEPK